MRAQGVSKPTILIKNRDKIRYPCTRCEAHTTMRIHGNIFQILTMEGKLEYRIRLTCLICNKHSVLPRSTLA